MSTLTAGKHPGIAVGHGSFAESGGVAIGTGIHAPKNCLVIGGGVRLDPSQGELNIGKLVLPNPAKRKD